MDEAAAPSSIARDRMRGAMAGQGGENMPPGVGKSRGVLRRFARRRHRAAPRAGPGAALGHSRAHGRFHDLGRQRAGIFRQRTVERAEAHDRGSLRLCAGARRSVGLSRAAFVRPRLFLAEGRGRADRRGDLEGRLRPHARQARGGAGGRRHRQDHHLSRQVGLSDHRRGDGAGGRRRADGAARGAAASSSPTRACSTRRASNCCPICRASSASSPRRPAR